MIVCIAEKKSQAEDIAKVLGAKSSKGGYFEGNGYCVTWTFGHLCTLKEPQDYNLAWKQWSLGALPMIPAKFGIKLIDQDSIKRQFSVIETLITQCDEVINCGDAGQEGELIQRWVMQKAKCQKPVKRLWISSLTDDAIRDGFKNLRSDKELEPLYIAGLCRAIGDWILGMNATRLYSLKYGQSGQVLSIGRVQTPTLALVVNRQLEIDNFIPKDYWELKTTYRDTVFSATIVGFNSDATYVEYEDDGEIIKAELNSRSNTYRIGQRKDAYYFEGNPYYLYEKSTSIIIWILPFMGLLLTVLGVLVIFDKVKVTVGGRHGREVTNGDDDVYEPDYLPRKKQNQDNTTRNQYDNGSDVITYDDNDGVFK